MKVNIEVIDGLTEDQVLIRCGRVNDTVQKIQKFVLEQAQVGDSDITFYKDNQEFYFPVDRVMFFETDGDNVYAHTKDDIYKTKLRLYELEQILPRSFVRASKSTIINISKVYSIQRNITSSSLVQFYNNQKHVYVSRHYYHSLRQRLNERSRL